MPFLQLLRTVAALKVFTLFIAPAPAALAQPSPSQPAAASGVPATHQLVASRIVPATARLEMALRVLGNDVLRHCVSADASLTRPFVVEAFAEAVAAAAQIELFAFGPPSAQSLPDRLLRPVADTAYGRRGMSAILANEDAPPSSPAELDGFEPTLSGLPTIEFVLLADDDDDPRTREARCQLAKVVAASVQIRTEAFAGAWRSNRLEHWSGDENEDETAERARLRDLLQSAIDAVDRLDQRLMAFDEAREGNVLPFLIPQFNLIYAGALMDGLAQRIALLMRYAEPEGPAADALASAANAISQAQTDLVSSGGRVDTGRLVPPIREARTILVDILPEAFDFAPTALLPPFGRTALPGPQR